MNQKGEKGEQGEQGKPAPPNGGGAGGQGGEGGAGGDAARTEWSDQLLTAKFEALIEALDRNSAVSNKLLWVFIGFLVSAVLALLSTTALLVVQLASG